MQPTNSRADVPQPWQQRNSRAEMEAGHTSRSNWSGLAQQLAAVASQQPVNVTGGNKRPALPSRAGPSLGYSGRHIVIRQPGLVSCRIKRHHS